MNKKVSLQLSNRFISLKKHTRTIYFVGVIFIGDDCYTGEDAVSKLFDLYPKLPENGFYAIVFDFDEKTEAVVDNVRSYPLFYWKTANGLVISDNINCFDNIENVKGIQKDNLYTFQTTGFCIGKETLLPNVYQVRPGAKIIISGETPVLEEITLFTYSPFYPEESKLSLFNFKAVLEKVFNRLVAYCNGRQIVLPLSGGLDSRLIAVYLKQIGYENVICFSYGKRESRDVVVSKRIAEKLKFKWEFIPYSRKKWNSFFKDPGFISYLNYADNYSSLPHIQDLLAVNEMMTNGVIDKDSIVVPGHTGDFICGGHIPIKYKHIQSISKSEFISDIIGKHFRVNNVQDYGQGFVDNLKERLGNYFDITSDVDLDVKKAARLLENFDWAERQSKFIINSIRVYVFYELDWYLPLWDRSIIEYWSDKSLSDKIGKNLYKRHLEDLFPDHFSDINKTHISIKEQYRDNKMAFKVISLIKSLQIYFMKKTKTLREFYNHPLQWYGMFSLCHVLRKKGFQNINSYLVDFYLKQKFENK